jgi:hypothetical protein
LDSARGERGVRCNVDQVLNESSSRVSTISGACTVE